MTRKQTNRGREREIPNHTAIHTNADRQTDISLVHKQWKKIIQNAFIYFIKSNVYFSNGVNKYVDGCVRLCGSRRAPALIFQFNNAVIYGSFKNRQK